MYECPNCEQKADKGDVEYECPFCGESDMGEGFYTCENCGTRFDYNGNIWKCEFCHNDGITEDFEEKCCPQCGEALEDPEYCYSCGWPDNQGWAGENY